MALGETLREFGVKVSLAFDGKKVDEAENKIRKFGAEMRSFALEVAGMTAAVFESQNLFTANARSLQNQADMLHLNTDELQEYEYAAKVAANANREDLVGSLQSLGDTLDRARAGVPEARQALYNMAQAAGRGGEMLTKLNDPMFKVTDAASLLSDGISKMSVNNPQAARRMTELAFGSDKLYNLWRQGPKAIAALNKEADKNFVINQKMIKAGAQMDIQMSKLWMMFRKMGYEIGFSVMKHLTPMINAFTKWFVANKKVIASGINAFLDALANGLQVVFTAAVAIANALGPVVQALGGTKNAMNLLISAFLVFKAMNIASAFVGMIGPIMALLPTLSTMIGVFSGLGEAFKAFSLIEGIADILPALELFGTGALAALAPLIPVMLAIGAATVGIHDLMTILSGGGFKDTWTGKGWEKVKEGVSFVGNKLGGMNVAGAAPYGQIAPQRTATADMAGTNVNNEHNITNNLTVTTAPHASVAETASAVKRAQHDANEDMLRKAQLDAARGRVR